MERESKRIRIRRKESQAVIVNRLEGTGGLLSPRSTFQDSFENGNSAAAAAAAKISQ